MEEKRKTPQIRFKGFTDDWEQCELGEVANIFDGTHQTPDYKDNGIMFLSVENINTLKSKKYISEESFMRDYKVYPQKGDILMTRIGDVGTPNVVKNTEKSAFYVSLALLKPNGIDSYFLCNSILSPRFQKGLDNRTLVSAVPKKINKDEIGKIEVLFSNNLDEQKLIGQFFQSIDKSINLHHRKCEKLKMLKKSMIEKMFSKNGEKVPEVRFKGFTDDWEQRKLGDYAKFRRGSFPQPYGKSEWYDGEWAMPFVQVVDVSNNLKLVENTKQKISKMAQPMSVFVPKGKVLVTLQGSIGRVAITQYEAFVDRTILIFEDFSECTDEYFWAYTIQNKFDIEKKIAPGGTIKTITKEALSVFDIQLPKIEEQKRIGLFFTNIDNLITLHQRKCEKLKEIKKSMLEKMFV